MGSSSPLKEPKPPEIKLVSHSWADKVRVSSSKNRFALKNVNHSLVGEIPRILVPVELTASSTSKWDRCLIGYFPGSSMPFHAVKAIASRVWSQYGLLNTIASDGFFVFRFLKEEGLHEILQSGPWMFGGKAFILQQWEASFVFNKGSIKTVPVWAKLHGLPLPLWTEDGLSFVASILGKPIACDKATHEGSRLAYARVCIELEASRQPTQFFELESCLSAEPIRVKVDYEWKPKRCHTCAVFGHNCNDSVDSKQDRDKLKNEELIQEETQKNKGKLIVGEDDHVAKMQKNRDVAGESQKLAPVDSAKSNALPQPAGPVKASNLALSVTTPLATIPPKNSNSKYSDLASCSKKFCGDHSQPALDAFGNNSLKKGFLNSVRPYTKHKANNSSSQQPNSCHPSGQQPLSCIEDCYNALWEDNHSDNLALVLSKISEFENNTGLDISEEDFPLSLTHHTNVLSQTDCKLNREVSLGSCNMFGPLTLDSDADFSENSDGLLSDASVNYSRKGGKAKKSEKRKGRKSN